MPRSYKTLLGGDTTASRVVRGLLALAAVAGTSMLGTQLDVFHDSRFTPTSGLMELFLLGLAFFPCGIFVGLGGVSRWMQTRGASAWPAVRARVFESDDGPSYGPVRSIAPIRYQVDGKSFENILAEFGSRSARPVPYSMDSEIEIRANPENPKLAVIATGDDTVMVRIVLGAAMIVAPFVLCWPMSWLSY